MGRAIQGLNRLWFTALGKRCACWEGRLMCVDPDPPRCFWDGRWYGQSERAYLGDWCSCEAAEWNCTGAPQLGSHNKSGTHQTRSIQDYFVFRPGDTAVLQEEERNLSDLAKWLLASRSRGIALAALVDIEEGKQAILLAEQRVENIRSALGRLGVTDDRFLLLPVELDPRQGDRVRRVRFELIPKPRRR